jgi:hypothetical protein
MKYRYIRTIRHYCNKGFEWIRELRIDKVIYHTNRILKHWGIDETVTFFSLPTPVIDSFLDEVYFYAIGVESTGRPLAYILLQRPSIVCHWGCHCFFPLPAPSKGVFSTGETSLPFPIPLPTALAAATFAYHFPVRNWVGSIGLFCRRNQQWSLIALLTISLSPEGSKGYRIEVAFEKRRAYCCLDKWSIPEYKSDVLCRFSGGHKKVVREVIRLAALTAI